VTNRDRLNDYFNGRPFALWCAVALVLAALAALALGKESSAHGGTGFFFTVNDSLIDNPRLSAIINVGCTLLTGVIMLGLNKVFSYVRTVTSLFVSAFFLLQLANPLGLVTFDAGTALCLAMVLSLMPIFSSYQDSHSQRSIFLVFVVAAAGSMFHYAFLLLIPVYILGLLYMRALNFKGLLAMIIGLVTPVLDYPGAGHRALQRLQSAAHRRGVARAGTFAGEPADCAGGWHGAAGCGAHHL